MLVCSAFLGWQTFLYVSKQVTSGLCQDICIHTTETLVAAKEIVVCKYLSWLEWNVCGNICVFFLFGKLLDFFRFVENYQMIVNHRTLGKAITEKSLVLQKAAVFSLR